VSIIRDAPELIDVGLPSVTYVNDLADNVVIACALKASAVVLVTGDKGILKLGQVEETRFLTPSGFIEWVKSGL